MPRASIPAGWIRGGLKSTPRNQVLRHDAVKSGRRPQIGVKGAFANSIHYELESDDRPRHFKAGLTMCLDRREDRKSPMKISSLWITAFTLIAVSFSGPVAAGYVITELAPATTGAEAHADTADAVFEALVPAECEHHDLSENCPACPACYGAVTASPEIPTNPKTGPASEHRAQFEQAVPQRELPPPRFA